MILSIANPPDNFNSVARFVETNKIPWPVMLDIGQVAYSYLLKGSFSQPQVFIVDANGIIYNHFEYDSPHARHFRGQRTHQRARPPAGQRYPGNKK